MNTFLYEDFLNNRQTYRALRAFWIKRLKSLMPAEENFETYANDKFADGTYFFDGNPIASVVSWRVCKAVRIVQLPPKEFGEYYTSHVNDIRLKKGLRSASFEVCEKVIALTLTKYSLQKAEEDIWEWLRNR
jgi:hypothetical protein